MVTTVNQRASQFWSKCVKIGTDELAREAALIKLKVLFFESLVAFRERICCYPTNVFVFSEPGKDKHEEIAAFREVLKKLKLVNSRLIFLTVDKKSAKHTHFFSIETSSRLTQQKLPYAFISSKNE